MPDGRWTAESPLHRNARRRGNERPPRHRVEVRGACTRLRGCRHGDRGPAEIGFGRSGYGLAAVAIRTVVAEDNLLLREGLVRLLSSAADIEMVSPCGDYDTVQAGVETEDPDVVLTDIKMPPASNDEGIRLARQARVSHPQMGVVAVSQFAEPEYVLGLFDSGSDRRAYLLKERLHDRATLISVVRSVAAGGSTVDSRIIEVLVSVHFGGAASPLAELMAREREMLAGITQGKSNSAIAADLFLTRQSVEKHISAIFLSSGSATPMPSASASRQR